MRSMIVIVMALILVFSVTGGGEAQPYWEYHLDTGRIVDFEFYQSVIWCATNTAVIRWHRDTGEYKTYVLDAGSGCFSIEVDSKGVVWVQVNNSLAVNRGSEFSFICSGDIDTAVNDLCIRAIHVADDDVLYIGTNHGVYSYYEGQWTHVAELPLKNVTAITQASDGRLFLIAASNAIWKTAASDGAEKLAGDPVYDYGIYILDNGEVTEYKTFNPNYRYLTGISVGADNHIYAVGGGMEGFVYHDGLDWDVVDVRDGLLSRDVLCAMEVKDGTSFIGTQSGLNRMVGSDPYEFETFTMHDGLPSNVILSVKQAPDGDIWFGTDRGLCRYDGTSFESYSTSALSGSVITCMAEDHLGNIWVGSRNGLSMYHNGEWLDIERFIGCHVVYLEAHDDMMWVIADRTVSVFQGNEWHSWDDDIPGYNLPLDKNTAIDAYGNFWMGSGHVMCFPADGGAAVKYVNGNCKNIVADRHGAVWTVEKLQDKYHVYKHSGGKSKYVKVVSQWHLYDFEYDGDDGVWTVSYPKIDGWYVTEIRHITETTFDRYVTGDALDFQTEDIFVDVRGTAWCVSLEPEMRLIRFDGGAWKTEEIDGEAIEGVNTVIPGSNDSYWVLRNRNEVLYCDSDGWRKVYEGDDVISAAKASGDGTLYLHSRNSLDILLPSGDVRHYSYPQEDAISRYDFLMLAADGSIWYSSGSYALIHARFSEILVEESDVLPRSLDLSVHPNPFNPSTSLSFSLDEASHVTAAVYTVNGQKIRTLANTPFTKGRHYIRWDGVDMHDNMAASGVYVVCVRAGSRIGIRKITLIR